jgi:hypothetical protein
MNEKPDFVKYLIYLDALRESGVTNMFGAIPYLHNEFPDLSEKEARYILWYWMDTFGERNKEATQ